jgi:hypothetical protein
LRSAAKNCGKLTKKCGRRNRRYEAQARTNVHFTVCP